MRAPVGYVWADSPLHRMGAPAKLLGLLACAALVVWASRPLELLAVALGVVLLVAVSRVGWRVAGRAAWGLRWFLVMVLAFNALLFSSADPLFSLGPLHLTGAGVAQGLRVVVRTLLVVVLGTLLTCTTRPQELVDGVRRLLRPLGHLGVPVEAAALAVGVTVQFVPTLLRETTAHARPGAALWRRHLAWYRASCRKLRAALGSHVRVRAASCRRALPCHGGPRISP